MRTQNIFSFLFFSSASLVAFPILSLAAPVEVSKAGASISPPTPAVAPVTAAPLSSGKGPASRIGILVEAIPGGLSKPNSMLGTWQLFTGGSIGMTVAISDACERGLHSQSAFCTDVIASLRIGSWYMYTSRVAEMGVYPSIEADAYIGSQRRVALTLQSGIGGFVSLNHGGNDAFLIPGQRLGLLVHTGLGILVHLRQPGIFSQVSLYITTQFLFDGGWSGIAAPVGLRVRF